ncbi:alpha/beta fold hydrolase [Mycolicibacterium farcinogenes]|uniref:Alpha/beta hydrolase n=1 Tax=Mycolicibacterium farcinogenes TaxID=1802 RepID=A0ACD1FCZ1_MYCFR|nr:alpha/beta hydrolase [Mycolicibacterium farcinogenes]QZH64921.1 alpha/beta hydrolase [Mycolicibacterium farcinogenes]
MNAVATDLAGRRAWFEHHVLDLEDGLQVGVSIGGRGVPMVFLHGLGLNRRHYLRLLNRIAALGFLVIAIDVAGHGDTADLPCEAVGLNDRTDLVLRTLDVLGVRRAVFSGHSMGGRIVIQLAANAPDRVLAALLIDAAAGASFDAALETTMRSPRLWMRTVAGAVTDLYRDPIAVKLAAVTRYLRMLTAVSMGRMLPHTGFVGAARAMMRSGKCAVLLRTLRDREIPTMVLHGESDGIVPFDCAVELADEADATLYRIPGAYHSWLINDPWRGADAVRQLLDRELGAALRCEATAAGMNDWRDAQAWEETLIEPDAWIRRLSNGTKTIGAGRRHLAPVEMELIRRASKEVARIATAHSARRRVARTA